MHWWFIGLMFLVFALLAVYISDRGEPLDKKKDPKFPDQDSLS